MYKKIVLTSLILIALISCSNRVQQPITYKTDFDQLREQHEKALSLWETQNITDYQITVKVFSSCLGPCNSEFVLSVHNNKLIKVEEIKTPEAHKDPKGTVFYNPRCHDYQRYMPSNFFNSVDLLLNDPNPQKGLNLSFTYDPMYGYIARYEMHYDGSECYELFEFSDFRPTVSE